MTNPERTLVDIMDRTDLCAGLATVAAALRVAWPQLDHDRLVRQVGRFGGRNGAGAPRLPRRASRARAVGSPLTECLHELIAPGYSVLERGGPNTGGDERRWMVRVNASGFTA